MFGASLNFSAFKDLVSAKDPVCGMDVERAKAAGESAYKGKTYYFCATPCKEAFDANPETYVAGA